MGKIHLSYTREILGHPNIPYMYLSRCRINQSNNSPSITMFVKMSLQQPSTYCGLTTISTTFPANAMYLKEKYISCTSYGTPPHELHQIMIRGHASTNMALKRKGYSLSPPLPHMIKSTITMCRTPCSFNLQLLVEP